MIVSTVCHVRGKGGQRRSAGSVTFSRLRTEKGEGGGVTKTDAESEKSNPSMWRKLLRKLDTEKEKDRGKKKGETGRKNHKDFCVR